MLIRAAYWNALFYTACAYLAAFLYAIYTGLLPVTVICIY